MFGLQDKELYSFGRPTYGRLGRDDVDANSDSPVSEAKAVGNLDGAAVKGVAAGMPSPSSYASQI